MSIFADLLASPLPPSQSTPHPDDLSTLPFPKPLTRPTFSTPTFDTNTFLVTHAQFRTLEDLHSELRQWLIKLRSEMDVIVERDWKGYLELEKGLRGGEGVIGQIEKRVKSVERDVLVCVSFWVLTGG
jgi:conserved oligomeric Golgi complex subunit 2